MTINGRMGAFYLQQLDVAVPGFDQQTSTFLPRPPYLARIEPDRADGRNGNQPGEIPNQIRKETGHSIAQILVGS